MTLALTPSTTTATTTTATGCAALFRSSVFLDQSYNSDKNQYIEFLTVVHIDLQLAVFIDTLVRAAGEHRDDLI